VARRAATQAHVALPATVALVGAAGAGRAPEQEASRQPCDSGVAERVEVRATSRSRCTGVRRARILINAGTGSIAYARGPDGKLHRAGGHGWQLGDEGGGYWMGRRALAAAARAHDARESSPCWSGCWSRWDYGRSMI